MVVFSILFCFKKMPHFLNHHIARSGTSGLPVCRNKSRRGGVQKYRRAAKSVARLQFFPVVNGVFDLLKKRRNKVLARYFLFFCFSFQFWHGHFQLRSDEFDAFYFDGQVFGAITEYLAVFFNKIDAQLSPIFQLLPAYFERTFLPFEAQIQQNLGFKVGSYIFGLGQI